MKEAITHARRLYRVCVVAALIVLLPCASASAEDRLVDITTLAPSIKVDLRYATKNNVVGRVMYARGQCFLREPVAKKLAAVQSMLREEHLGLLVWDCYRPRAVQAQLWVIAPDRHYVADPKRGSRHNRGAAVDLTLVDADGHALRMPTAFDDLSESAHRDATTTPEAAKNRARLRTAMEKAGFVPLTTEWWHFDDAQWREYPLTDVALESLAP